MAQKLIFIRDYALDISLKIKFHIYNYALKSIFLSEQLICLRGGPRGGSVSTDMSARLYMSHIPTTYVDICVCSTDISIQRKEAAGCFLK